MLRRSELLDVFKSRQSAKEGHFRSSISEPPSSKGCTKYEKVIEGGDVYYRKTNA